jgi:N-acetylmuramoyl-L-alanine amidase
MRRVTGQAAALLAAVATQSASAQTILLDVGHSLAAPGSTAASGATEFSYNRALALEVARAMRARGWRVVMPNADGSMRSLAARPAAASAAKADLFLSIHHDAIQAQYQPYRDRFSGFSTWASGAHPAAARSRVCADAIGRSMADGGMRPALYHAERIPGESRDLQDASTGRYRRDDLAVLRLSKTTAVLVEAGVIVNPNEEAWLARPDVRAGIAARIVDGVARCLTSR